MFISRTLSSTRIPVTLGVGVLVFAFSGVAYAQVYDFNRFLSGGGGGGDPQKQQIARGSGTNICISVLPNTIPPNTVRFMVQSKLAHPNSRIRAIAFDTGKHVDLIRNVSVILKSIGVTANVIPPKAHAFLPNFSPDYWVDIPSPSGFKPGSMIIMTATLGGGKTYSDVINAINEGFNPTSGAGGLRIGVIAISLLGGPPPGVATIMDDGGFLMNGPSQRCQ